VRRWNSAELPFLEEKLEFRRKHIEGLLGGCVLCVYAGGEARLTKMYAERFKVFAVDKSLPNLPSSVVRIQMSDKAFLKSLRDFSPRELEVLDLDPYGSPMPFLRGFFSEFKGRVKRVILTDGLLTSVKMKRRVNFYKHYGLKPAETIKARDWHYKHFPSLLFSGVKDVVQSAGYAITYFDYEFNRYRTAIYARFDLRRCEQA